MNKTMNRLDQSVSQEQVGRGCRTVSEVIFAAMMTGAATIAAACITVFGGLMTVVLASFMKDWMQRALADERPAIAQLELPRIIAVPIRVPAPQPHPGHSPCGHPGACSSCPLLHVSPDGIKICVPPIPLPRFPWRG